MINGPKNPFRGVPVIPSNQTKILMCPNCHMKPLSILIADTGMMVLNCQDCNASYTLKRVKINNAFEYPLILVKEEKCKLIERQYTSPKCWDCEKPMNSDNGTWKKYVHLGGQILGDDIQKYWYEYHCKCGYKTSLVSLDETEMRNYVKRD